MHTSVRVTRRDDAGSHGRESHGRFECRRALVVCWGVLQQNTHLRSGEGVCMVQFTFFVAVAAVGHNNTRAHQVRPLILQNR